MSNRPAREHTDEQRAMSRAAGLASPDDFPVAECTSCGNVCRYDTGEPVELDDCVHCELCGNPVCDDCCREAENVPYCVDCFVQEIDPDGEYE